MNCITLLLCIVLGASDGTALENEVSAEFNTILDGLRSGDRIRRQVAVHQLRWNYLEGVDLNWSQVGLDNDSLKRFRAASRLISDSLTFVIAESHEATRSDALWLVAALGSKGREFTPYLVRIVDDHSLPAATRLEAARALLFVTPESVAVSPLIELPIDLWPSGPPQLSGASIYIEMLIDTLFSSGHTMVEVPYILRLLDTDRRDIRLFVLQTLYRLGPEAKSAVPILWGLLCDADPDIRKWAAISILSITANPDDVNKLLGRLPPGDRTEFQQEASKLFNERAKEIAELREAIMTDNPILINMITWQIRHGSGPVRRRLVRMLEDIQPLPADIRRAMNEVGRSSWQQQQCGVNWNVESCERPILFPRVHCLSHFRGRRKRLLSRGRKYAAGRATHITCLTEVSGMSR